MNKKNKLYFIILIITAVLVSLFFYLYSHFDISGPQNIPDNDSHKHLTGLAHIPHQTVKIIFLKETELTKIEKFLTGLITQYSIENGEMWIQLGIDLTTMVRLQLNTIPYTSQKGEHLISELSNRGRLTGLQIYDFQNYENGLIDVYYGRKDVNKNKIELSIESLNRSDSDVWEIVAEDSFAIVAWVPFTGFPGDTDKKLQQSVEQVVEQLKNASIVKNVF